MKVIIAGGGIAGLTLANALEQADIDYVLLERRNVIAPQVGASIGILSNGCRILDQLGCRESLYACVRKEPIVWMHDRDKNGRLLAKASTVSQLMKARSGYAFAFSDRQDILKVLYDNLKDKSKILLCKNLTTVRQHESGVTVVCDDGTSFVGDILAGADGVNSKARSEMWRLADEVDPELVKKDKTSLESQYQCLYGIASSSSGLAPGEIDVGYNEKRSTMAIVGKNDRTYYFVFQKMDKTYKHPYIPKYTEADKIEYAERHGDLKVTDKVLLRDLHKNSVSSTLVGIETATYKIWTWGRIACLGDSAHKMTPNAGKLVCLRTTCREDADDASGFGGNAAIESAAALANSIKKLTDKSNGQHPTQEQIVACLQDYQRSREIRAAAAIETSNFLTHVQALATWGHAIFARYGLNVMGDFLENLTSDISVGATMIDYLPAPEASLSGTMPFNPEQGQGNKENLLVRALLASPFLVAFAYAYSIVKVTPITGAGDVSNSFGYHTALTSSSLTSNIFNFGGPSNSSATSNDVYMSASANLDPAAGIRTASYLAYFGVVLAIWSLEAVRCCNALMPVQLPGLFALFAQMKGAGMVAPLYYFAHWVLTPIDSFRSTDMRLTNMKYTRAILPSLLMVYYLPLLQSYLLPEISQRQTWLQIWQLFPITHSLAQFAISKIWKDTVGQDKIHAPKRDVATIRYTVGIPALISTIVWVYTAYTTTTPLHQIFWPQHTPASVADSQAFTSEIMQWNFVLFVTPTYLWLLYFAWDAKAAGMISHSWIIILGALAAATVTLGPGGAVGVGFLYREFVITEKRHKGAITRESLLRGAVGGK
ncbi:FAD/NAD(P)-binding domain-containing protein [Aureobasidium sp. EXF-10727]|nr:FAD/NAD(P)-binding domain-containing protein [Aureobasidium sp. EXF-10727]